jgi:hypothetical protein
MYFRITKIYIIITFKILKINQDIHKHKLVEIFIIKKKNTFLQQQSSGYYELE